MEDNPLFKNFQENCLALSFDKYTFFDEVFSNRLYFSETSRETPVNLKLVELRYYI